MVNNLAITLTGDGLKELLGSVFKDLFEGVKTVVMFIAQITEGLTTGYGLIKSLFLGIKGLFDYLPDVLVAGIILTFFIFVIRFIFGK